MPSKMFQMYLEVFFAIVKPKFVTFELQNLAQLGRAAIKYSNFAFLLGLQFFEDFVPIRTSSIGTCLEACDQVSLGLKKIKQIASFTSFIISSQSKN